MNAQVILNSVVQNATGSLVLKATIVMMIALLLVRVTRRSSASLRHSLLAAAFGVLLLLPVATMLIPAKVVKYKASVAAGFSRPVAAAKIVPAEAAAHTEPASRPVLPSITLRDVYVGGVGFFLLSLALGVVRLYKARRDAQLSVQATAMANRMRGSGGVEVAFSNEIAVPITFSSVILLPEASKDWTIDELSRALRHELEHISRRDWYTQLLARLAVAVFWPHPFVWALWRQLRLEAERACDDAVIRTSGDAESYAEQLVGLARALVGRRDVPAVAIAAPSRLGVRVEAILDRRLRRNPLTRWSASAVLVAATAFLLALAPVKFMNAATNDESGDRYDRAGEVRELDEALLHAAEIGDVQIIRRYLDIGARANAAISGDGSPLIAAARKGHVDAMRLLIDSGADVNLGVRGDGSPLIVAAQHGHFDAVRLLVDRGANIDAGIEGDGNALIMAAGADEVAIVQYLLDRGASIEKVVAGDEDPLIHASEMGAINAVRLLISRGANVNAQVWVDRGDGDRAARELRTPLVMARRNGHADVVSALLAAGAKE